MLKHFTDLVVYFHFLTGLGVSYLYKQHSVALFTEALRSYEVDAQWSLHSCPEHLLLVRLLQGPPVGDNVLFCTPECVEKLVDFVCNASNEGEKLLFFDEKVACIYTHVN